MLQVLLMRNPTLSWKFFGRTLVRNLFSHKISAVVSTGTAALNVLQAARNQGDEEKGL
jgi:hypothetical protein